MSLSRHGFLAGCAGCLAGSTARTAAQRRSPSVPSTDVGFPDPERQWRGDSSVAAARRVRPTDAPPLTHPPSVCGGPFDSSRVAALLRARFPEPRRHFIFEYYPWYGTDPWRHWDHWDRQPPVDLAVTSVPLLGPYDSGATHTLEQHAEWMAASGAGAVNLSWWGRDSFSDRAVGHLMDVFRAYDVKVTFHLEPYRDRGTRFAEDIAYLLRTYGERRGWDSFLLLDDGNGSRGPVFKVFRTLLPRRVTDCHGVVHEVPGYTADGDWRRQIDALRQLFREDFDHVTFLADSSDAARVQRAGFDGLALFDNFVEPDAWAGHAAAATDQGIVFSFNTNPGFDAVVRRGVPPGSCYRSAPFEPGAGVLDWRADDDRDRAHRLAERRIVDSLHETLRLQTDPCLGNAAAGFLLVYINSFNEWHEGHQFEPAKAWSQLTAAERALAYHNPSDGAYRLRTLARELRSLLG